MQLGGAPRLFRSTIDSRGRNSKDCVDALVQFPGINAVRVVSEKSETASPARRSGLYLSDPRITQ
jgi:hypothetical protein